MATTDPTTKTHRSRSVVRREYGHPWPWRSKQLLREEYVEKGRDPRAIAEDFGCHPKTVSEYITRHGLAEGEGR